METIISNSAEFDKHTIHNIFYGRGRGIHSTQSFTGIYLKEVINKYFMRTQKALQ